MLLNLIVVQVAIEEVNLELLKIKSSHRVIFTTDGKHQEIVFGDTILWDSNSDLEFYTEWKLIEHLMSELSVCMQMTFY